MTDIGARATRQDRTAAGAPQVRAKRVRIATRTTDPYERTSVWMRLDLLQIVAWSLGGLLVVFGIVVLARAGLDELTLFQPVASVAGLAGSPMLAGLLVLLGTVLLVAATGDVDERGLRVIGALLLIVGAVWVIEPAAFEPYLGIERRNGVAAIVVGTLLAAASFVPPLAIRRPGTGELGGW